MIWESIERPGVFGDSRDKIYASYDLRFGKDNWRISYQVGDKVLGFYGICKIFEDGYFKDSFRRPELWDELKVSASNVFDIDHSDLNSGLDYLAQNNSSNHIQDIAIRNVFQRRAWVFEGDDLVQIRGGTGYFGNKLTPYRINYDFPLLIHRPLLPGTWGDSTLESLFQNSKILEVKRYGNK